MACSYCESAAQVCEGYIRVSRPSDEGTVRLLNAEMRDCAGVIRSACTHAPAQPPAAPADLHTIVVTDDGASGDASAHSQPPRRPPSVQEPSAGRAELIARADAMLQTDPPNGWIEKHATMIRDLRDALAAAQPGDLRPGLEEALAYRARRQVLDEQLARVRDCGANRISTQSTPRLAPGERRGREARMSEPSVAELLESACVSGDESPAGYQRELTLYGEQADALIALADAVLYSITDNDWTPCDPLCPGCEPIECPPSKLARAFAAFAKSLGASDAE